MRCSRCACTVADVHHHKVSSLRDGLIISTTLNSKIILLCMSPGDKLKRIVIGQADNCQPKPNGNTPRAAMTSALSHGVKIKQMDCSPISICWWVIPHAWE